MSFGSSIKKRRSVRGTLHHSSGEIMLQTERLYPHLFDGQGSLCYVILHYQTAVSLASNNLLNAGNRCLPW